MYQVALFALSAVGVGLAVWMVFVPKSKIRRTKAKRLGPREELSVEEFYGRFYAQKGLRRHVIAELLPQLGEALEVPAGLLRPEDRFWIEHAPIAGAGIDDHLDLYDLMLRVERRYNFHFDRPRIETVDQFLRAAAKASMVGCRHARKAVFGMNL